MWVSPKMRRVEEIQPRKVTTLENKARKPLQATSAIAMSSKQLSTLPSGLSSRSSVLSMFGLSSLNTDRAGTVGASIETGTETQGTKEESAGTGRRRRVWRGISRLLHGKPWTVSKLSGDSEDSNLPVERMMAVSDPGSDGLFIKPKIKSQPGSIPRSASQLTIRMIGNGEEDAQKPEQQNAEGKSSVKA